MAGEMGDFYVESSILNVGVFPFYPGDLKDNIGTLCRLLFTESSNPLFFAPSPNLSILLKCYLSLILITKVAFVSRNVVFRKSLFKLSCVYLSLEKLINGKHFSVKEKLGLVFRKVFSFYFGRKTLSESCEKFKNVILFAAYIKFGPQTFDFYIYFILNICFLISSLRI
jgi:hypothetical protein